MKNSEIGRGNAAGSKATQFQPGHPGRRGAKKGETGPPKGQPLPCQLLRDMRRSYALEESERMTPAQKSLRQWFEDNPKEFLSLFRQLERDHQAQKEKTLKE